MNQNSEKEKLDLFKSLFRGREDVFAVHWKKGNRSGYVPACHFDPYIYRHYKIKGDKTHLPLTDEQLLKHFKGEQLIGIYPLLQDNKSWFIAADFDKEGWVQECQAFMNAVKKKISPLIWNAPVPAKEATSGYFLTNLTKREKAGEFSLPC